MARDEKTDNGVVLQAGGDKGIQEQIAELRRRIEKLEADRETK